MNCPCGWPLPREVKTSKLMLARLLLSCGRCGAWWYFRTDEKGTWSREEKEKGESR